MLKKLFVHEWKDCWKLVGALNLAVIILTLIGTFALNQDLTEIIDNNEYVAMTFVLYIFLYFVAVMALSFVTTFFFFHRFYKNLYTDEGYLMHTLPVKSHELIWSKTFVALIWQMISGLVTCFSFASFIDCMLRLDSEYDQSIWSEFWSLILEALREIPMNAPIVILIIEVVLLGLISPFFATFMGYTAISLGQCTKKHKLLASVGIYFGISTLIQWIVSFASVPFAAYLSTIEDGSIMQVAGLYGIMCVLYAGITIVFYLLTNHIMKNRLNLE